MASTAARRESVLSPTFETDDNEQQAISASIASKRRRSFFAIGASKPKDKGVLERQSFSDAQARSHKSKPSSRHKRPSRHGERDEELDPGKDADGDEEEDVKTQDAYMDEANRQEEERVRSLPKPTELVENEEAAGDEEIDEEVAKRKKEPIYVWDSESALDPRALPRSTHTSHVRKPTRAIPLRQASIFFQHFASPDGPNTVYHSCTPRVFSKGSTQTQGSTTQKRRTTGRLRKRGTKQRR